MVGIVIDATLYEEDRYPYPIGGKNASNDVFVDDIYHIVYYT